MSVPSPSRPSRPLHQGVRIRHLTDDDWTAVVDLEFRTYDPAGLSEGRAALESRVSASPSTCFVLDVDRRLAGYVLALPYPEHAYPELAEADPTAFESGNLHLHDMVVADSLRGRGLGRHLLRHLSATALTRGFRRISLVAVGGSDTFWAGNGFVAQRDVVPSGGYGPDAVYMSRAVRAPAPAAGRVPAAGSETTASRARSQEAGRPRGAAPASAHGRAPGTDGIPPHGPSPHPRKG
ncbi:GNAT family N-acetyltransferase [Streptomyces fuscigenes]|uniref:GNAT family N-acetyltransferase n=1 Tax=Streptomyces fuscigenes TaxID=1528880 RepID=UPI0027E02F6E|nr:GNAT family N-acetyltransferase [Streptomyces fuscigenes]